MCFCLKITAALLMCSFYAGTVKIRYSDNHRKLSFSDFLNKNCFNFEWVILTAVLIILGSFEKSTKSHFQDFR